MHKQNFLSIKKPKSNFLFVSETFFKRIFSYLDIFWVGGGEVRDYRNYDSSTDERLTSVGQSQKPNQLIIKKSKPR